MGDQDLAIDARDLQTLLTNVTPRLADPRGWQDYLRALAGTGGAVERALALQQAAGVVANDEEDGGPAARAVLAAADAELTTLVEDLCATPPRLPSIPPQAQPLWSAPWPFPSAAGDQASDPAVPAGPLPAVVLLACGAALQAVADELTSYAQHEPFSKHQPFATAYARHEPFSTAYARHEPFSTAASRLLEAGLAALAAQH